LERGHATPQASEGGGQEAARMTDEEEGGLKVIIAGSEDSGERADRFLAARLDGTSRSRIKGLIEDGAVTVDGGTLSDPALRVKAGQTFAILVPEPLAA